MAIKVARLLRRGKIKHVYYISILNVIHTRDLPRPAHHTILLNKSPFTLPYSINEQSSSSFSDRIQRYTVILHISVGREEQYRRHPRTWSTLLSFSSNHSPCLTLVYIHSPVCPGLSACPHIAHRVHCLQQRILGSTILSALDGLRAIPSYYIPAWTGITNLLLYIPNQTNKHTLITYHTHLK